MQREPRPLPIDPLKATLRAAIPLFSNDIICATATEFAFFAARRESWERKVLRHTANLVWAARAVRAPDIATVIRGRFLVVAQHSGAGWASLVPVIAGLRARGEDVTVAATSSVLARHAQTIRGMDAAVVSLDREAFRRVLAPTALTRERSKAAWREFGPRLRVVGSPGSDMGDYFRALAARYVAYRQVLTALLQAHQDTVLVNHADFTVAGGAGIDAARALGRREVTLQHGLPSDEYFPTRSADYVIWGEGFRSRFEQHGARPESLVALGAPRLDMLTKLAVSEQSAGRARGRAQWGIADEQTAVLFLSHRHSPAPTGLHEAVDSLLLEAAGREPDAAWIVRPHPQESAGAWAARTQGSNVRVDGDTKLQDALLGADLLVSPFSSTLLEGMILGRPAVQVLPVAQHLVPHYVGSEAVAHSPTRLIEFVRECRGGLARWIDDQRTVLRHWVANAGFATDAVSDYLTTA